jgi:hypothetical protein
MKSTTSSTMVTKAWDIVTSSAPCSEGSCVPYLVLCIIYVPYLLVLLQTYWRRKKKLKERFSFKQVLIQYLQCHSLHPVLSHMTNRKFPFGPARRHDGTFHAVPHEKQRQMHDTQPVAVREPLPRKRATLAHFHESLCSHAAPTSLEIS